MIIPGEAGKELVVHEQSDLNIASIPSLSADQGLSTPRDSVPYYSRAGSTCSTINSRWNVWHNNRAWVSGKDGVDSL